MIQRKIRFDTQVPDEECHTCPFSSCAHPLQMIFTEYYSQWTTFAKLCIKDLAPHDRRKVLERVCNHGCVRTVKTKKEVELNAN